MAKLRAYDNKVLADNYAILAQMLEKIIQTMRDAETDELDDLPPSVIPTGLLYNVAVAYSVMYDALEEHSLKASGHAKPTYSIH